MDHTSSSSSNVRLAAIALNACPTGGCGAQAAAVYVDQSLEEVGRGGVATAVQHHGKEVCAYA